MRARPLVLTLIGVLSFIATLGSSVPVSLAQASQKTNDVALTMSESRSTLAPGKRVLFAVRMTNLGPSNADFVDVSFHIPPQLKVVAITCDLGISPDGLFCEYSSLPRGATVVSRLVVTTDTSVRVRSHMLRASAAVSFENPGVLDPDLRNNTASVRLWLVVRHPAP